MGPARPRRHRRRARLHPRQRRRPAPARPAAAGPRTGRHRRRHRRRDPLLPRRPLTWYTMRSPCSAATTPPAPSGPFPRPRQTARCAMPSSARPSPGRAAGAGGRSPRRPPRRRPARGRCDGLLLDLGRRRRADRAPRVRGREADDRPARRCVPGGVDVPDWVFGQGYALQFDRPAQCAWYGHWIAARGPGGR